MIKTFKIEVDCPTCAMKAEDYISKVRGIRSAKINFIMQKLTVDMEDGDLEGVIKNIEKAGKKADRDFSLIA